MQRDDETTATQIHELLVYNGISISLSTVLRCREQLGWKFRGSAFCQLIREANKVKRALWHQKDQFENVIHWRSLCSDCNSLAMLLQKKKEKSPSPSLAPSIQLKYMCGQESACWCCYIYIFTGTMDAQFYVGILEDCLIPFLRQKFADREHRFMQDNDPKHCSRTAKQFLKTIMSTGGSHLQNHQT